MSKFREKHAQHQQLTSYLKDAGYADVKLHLLIFGSTAWLEASTLERGT